MLVSGAAETSVAARTAAMMPAARDVDGQEFADDNAAIQEARAVARTCHTIGIVRCKNASW